MNRPGCPGEFVTWLRPLWMEPPAPDSTAVRTPSAVVPLAASLPLGALHAEVAEPSPLSATDAALKASFGANQDAYVPRFVDNVHQYIREHVRNADQKAVFFFGATTAPSDSRRYAAERGSAIPTPPTTLHTRTAYTPNRRHDSASSATYPPTRPRQSRLLLSAISPAPRRQSGSAHRTAPGRYADLRSLSRSLLLRSWSSRHRSRTASCPRRSSPSASST